MNEIWSPLDIAPVQKQLVSNQAVGRVYQERLQALLLTCDPANVPAFRGHYSRQWFADQIGCPKSTLTTSVRLRKSLAVWEEKHRDKIASGASRCEDDDTNIVRLPRKKSGGRIYKVPLSISSGNRPATKIVPTLVWEDGMDEWVSDYARHLIFRSPNGTSSVDETVKKLRQFRTYQRRHKVPYDQVTDDFLVAFQSEMEARGRAKKKRRDEIISAVHDFFKWADGQGLLTNHVQTRPKGEYDLPNDYRFPISSELALVRGSHGRTHEKWVSTLTGGASDGTYRMRHTPNSDEVLRLGEVVESKVRNGVRNKLIMDWALFTGARVSEIVQLQDVDFPTFDDMQAFFDDTGGLKVFEVWVERKNRGRAMLRAPGDLVLRTAEYLALDEQRAAIVAAMPGRKRNNSGPVFLSERGGALHTDSISRIFRQFFNDAGIKRANIHRLRAKFITEMIEFQLDRYAAGGIEVDTLSTWQDTVLISACQAMGHSHPISLLPYLTEILQRRNTRDGKIEPRSIESRERSLQDAVKQLSASLSMFPRLQEIQELVASKRIAEAIEVMADVQEQLMEML